MVLKFVHLSNSVSTPLIALKIVQTCVKLCFHSADGIEHCPDLRQLCVHFANGMKIVQTGLKLSVHSTNGIEIVQTYVKLCVHSTDGIKNCPDLRQTVFPLR